MSDILFLPVKPKWASLIMSGQKTLELRRRLPSKGYGNPCVIYASSPQCEIVGTCALVRGRAFGQDDITPGNLSRACVTEDEFDAYFSDQYFGAFADPGDARWYALELAKPEPFRLDVPLVEMRQRWDLEPPQQWRYIDQATFDDIVKAGR